MFAQGDVESAVRHVHRILTNRDLASRLSTEGKDWARQFSIESVAQTLRGIYGAGVARRAPREAAVV